MCKLLTGFTTNAKQGGSDSTRTLVLRIERLWSSTSTTVARDHQITYPLKRRQGACRTGFLSSNAKGKQKGGQHDTLRQPTTRGVSIHALGNYRFHTNLNIHSFQVTQMEHRSVPAACNPEYDSSPLNFSLYFVWGTQSIILGRLSLWLANGQHALKEILQCKSHGWRLWCCWSLIDQHWDMSSVYAKAIFWGTNRRKAARNETER